MGVETKEDESNGAYEERRGAIHMKRASALAGSSWSGSLVCRSVCRVFAPARLKFVSALGAFALLSHLYLVAIVR